jgi:hypothetical protein
VDGWVCVWHSYFVISSLYNHCRFCQFRQPGQCSGCYSGHEWLPDWHEETQSPAQTAQRRQPTLLAYVPSKWIGAHRTIAPHLKMHPSNFLLNNYKTKNHTETYHLTGIQIQIRNKLYLLLITSFVHFRSNRTGRRKTNKTCTEIFEKNNKCVSCWFVCLRVGLKWKRNGSHNGGECVLHNDSKRTKPIDRDAHRLFSWSISLPPRLLFFWKMTKPQNICKKFPIYSSKEAALGDSSGNSRHTTWTFRPSRSPSSPLLFSLFFERRRRRRNDIRLTTRSTQ